MPVGLVHSLLPKRMSWHWSHDWLIHTRHSVRLSKIQSKASHACCAAIHTLAERILLVFLNSIFLNSDYSADHLLKLRLGTIIGDAEAFKSAELRLHLHINLFIPRQSRV